MKISQQRTSHNNEHLTISQQRTSQNNEYLTISQQRTSHNNAHLTKIHISQQRTTRLDDGFVHTNNQILHVTYSLKHKSIHVLTTT